ncbi:MAG: CBS domain-containing protein [Anaerolineae bacterium]|nr:CBS domain-containing protein [Anaerolineae bacterium]
MNVIATHENTDFDGFSALVAASKLFPSALALLPHQMNRNVRGFHALYQDRLLLHRPNDLPREHVDTLILVDTQTPPQLRGVDGQTSLVIVDHHSMDQRLANATYELDTTGSTTTMLVERLLESGIGIDPLEATLFVLGIYEDTGGLTYSGTTPRDLLAAARLMELGANLEIVREFLSYPLTDEQRQLYHRLAQSLTTFLVEGVTVAVAAAESEVYVEEVSVLAHRLMDLYEPQALFLLAKMDDHIQMVARSEKGTIDVGRVARHFGGGGHARASAALVRERSLNEVKRELRAYLPVAVEPTTTVRQIMSYGVHVLAPDTRVAEAAALMQRYGHEGFPVVEGGKPVGIITRREIDRALHHGLDRAPVRVYMRAQGVSVDPETGVRELQRLMTEHDIGQVPVVEDGRVIGIVTRTDLIKLWAAEGEGASKPPRVVERLESALPAPLWRVLRIAADVADDMGYNLYAVGGFVRDLLLGFPNLDLDLVVEGDAIALAQQLAKRLGGEVKSHRRFGTAKWVLERETMAGQEWADLPEHVDFATARTEFYERPSALPIVERSSIKQDLHRRDFTINTLAITLNPGRLGEVLDFFGGLRDLDQGVVRVLHSLSFVEDPTRMLRAVRLEARLGFQIEERTAELIRDAAELLERTSGERVAGELMLILQEEAPERALARLQEFGLLERVAEGLRFTPQLHTAMEAARMSAPRFEVKTADLPQTYLCLLVWDSSREEIQSLVTRLRLSRAVARLVSQVPALREVVERLGTAALTPSQVYRWLEPYAAPGLLAAYAVSCDERARERLLRYQTEWRRVRPQITGRDLRGWGLKPGPIYREVLEALREAVLDGVVAGRQEEERLVRKWLAEPSRLAEVREGAER